MKRPAKAKKPRAPRDYTEAQLSGLRTSTSARRQATVERLQAAIEALNAKKQAITVQSIYEECGLRYAAIHRNPEALALFRANSTHLTAKKKRVRRKAKTNDAGTPVPRDPLLNYNKPQLVARVRAAQQQLRDLERQLATLAETCLQRDAQMAALEAKLAELEPYRNFVEQVRQRVRQEEHEGEP
jgi:vacuolar-type H+-ATPase subunit E/Vma4